MSDPSNDVLERARTILAEPWKDDGFSRDLFVQLVETLERYRAWVADLMAGTYVNCVYCGHRYGPGDTTPVAMADALKAHIAQCNEHPIYTLRRAAGAASYALKSYAHGNASPELAAGVAATLDAAIAETTGQAAEPPATLPFPRDLSDSVKDALGIMVFQSGPIAHLFRAAGRDIPNQIEAEQAAVLHWAICLALEHGAGWRDKASDELDAMRASVTAREGSR